ncbi:MAG: PDDEXK nuclease domain-containing protein [Oscillospiraceae bacterium]|nr:PDDEXK nuclease domain-containing protein [Oscillospiraceae bacterium]
MNREIALMYWEVGVHINSIILDGERAAYGKNILATLSTKLIEVYGNSFYVENIYRMMRFAKVFIDFEILSTASTKLSWSHFCEIMRVKTEEGRLFYAHDAVERNLGVHALRKEISRKAFERREIANTQLSEVSKVPFNTFKDPFLLDVLGLKDNYLEADLEQAILLGIESFILEFGHGLTFVAKQKRMTMDGVDFKLDLLFYSRELRRLIAIDLKLDMFKPAHKGQMEFYLKWLDRYDRYEGENPPIGLILCAKAHRGQIELMELDKSGIAVAEYWTVLPPKAEFEHKIQEILLEARERLERRKMLPSGDVQCKIEYFYEPKDDE